MKCPEWCLVTHILNNSFRDFRFCVIFIYPHKTASHKIIDILVYNIKIIYIHLDKLFESFNVKRFLQRNWNYSIILIGNRNFHGQIPLEYLLFQLYGVIILLEVKKLKKSGFHSSFLLIGSGTCYARSNHKFQVNVIHASSPVFISYVYNNIHVYIYTTHKVNILRDNRQD